MEAFLQSWNPLVQSLVVAACAVLVGLAIHYLLFKMLHELLRRVPSSIFSQGILLKHVARPLRLLFPLIVLHLSIPLIQPGLTPAAFVLLEDLLYVMVVIAIAWLFIKATDAFEEMVGRRYEVETQDNLQARKVLTQTKILKRIVVVGIGMLALALIFMNYEAFRELGAGILASAGIAGLVVGLAAQRTLGNLLAGFQIAITQPIRVDDIVIVEGDFGWVEEITLTYVVVRVWDLRRIVVPISHFIEKPFQNWTRTSSNLLGTAFLYVDYTVPVEEVRQELQRIVEGSDRWDGRACALQVTDTSERTVELRALASASSAPKLFELRCEMREKLLAYLKEHYPGALPRVRAEMQDQSEVPSPLPGRKAE